MFYFLMSNEVNDFKINAILLGGILNPKYTVVQKFVVFRYIEFSWTYYHQSR